MMERGGVCCGRWRRAKEWRKRNVVGDGAGRKTTLKLSKMCVMCLRVVLSADRRTFPNMAGE